MVALAAAVLIAVQLPAAHWFYFYLVWIAPLILAAVMSAYREPAAADAAGGEHEMGIAVPMGSARST